MSDVTTWFDDLPVLGKLPPDHAAAALRDLGEDAAADVIVEAAARARDAFGPSVLDRLLGRDPRGRLYGSTAHAFGHLAPAPPGDAFLPLRHAGNIAPEVGLRGGR